MKNIFNTLATILIAIGLIVMAGSANDCDGKCMETANTLPEMLMLVGIGVAFMTTGTAILFANRREA
tara:strand:- start:6558 stop:6758 length:201 start_codon:yes stop_codon:yes gene_type:complete